LPSNVKPEQHYKTEQYKQEQFKSEPSNTSAPVQRSAQPPNGASIKQEQAIKYETPQSYSHPQAYGSFNQESAQARAHQLLQQQYGSQANASIQAAQARQGPMPHNQRPNHIQMPNPRPGQPQYPQPQPPLSTAQTDGAGDDGMDAWKAALADRRVAVEDRRAADHQLRDYLQQLAAFEDSGLLLPVSEQSKKSKKRRTATSSLPVASIAPAIAGPGQLDGPDDEDSKESLKKDIDSDEDAINSDLDDSDDELENVDDDEGNEGPMGETILCVYEKVQRVKNKVRNLCHGFLLCQSADK
jgi:transcription initiation factor TFIIA large subunit